VVRYLWWQLLLHMSILIWSLVLELLGLESAGRQAMFAGFRIVLTYDAGCYVLRWVGSGSVVVVLYIWHSLCNWQDGCRCKEHILPVSWMIWSILMLYDVHHI